MLFSLCRPAQGRGFCLLPMLGLRVRAVLVVLPSAGLRVSVCLGGCGVGKSEDFEDTEDSGQILKILKILGRF